MTKKSKVLERKAFQDKDADVENVGIMQGFIDMLVSEEDEPEDEQDMAVALGRTPDNPEILMNTLSGEMRSIDARREELADQVGYAAAMETPDSVLALLQVKQEEGIGALPQGMPQGMPPMMPPGNPPMMPPASPPPGGIASLPTDQGPMPQPIQMKKGGIVQNFSNGGGADAAYLNLLANTPNLLDAAIQPRYGAYQRALGPSLEPLEDPSVLALISQAGFRYAQEGDAAKALGEFSQRVSPLLGKKKQRDDALKMMAIKAAEESRLAALRATNKGALTGFEKLLSDNYDEFITLETLEDLNKFGQSQAGREFFFGLNDRLKMKDRFDEQGKFVGRTRGLLPTDVYDKVAELTGNEDAARKFFTNYGYPITKDVDKAAKLGPSLVPLSPTTTSDSSLDINLAEGYSPPELKILSDSSEKIVEDVKEDKGSGKEKTEGGLFFVPKPGSVSVEQMNQPLTIVQGYNPKEMGLYDYAPQLSDVGVLVGGFSKFLPDMLGATDSRVQLASKAKNLAKKSVPAFLAAEKRIALGIDQGTQKVGTGSDYMSASYREELKNITDLEGKVFRSQRDFENSVLQNHATLLKLKKSLEKVIADDKRVKKEQFQSAITQPKYSPESVQNARSNLESINSALKALNVPPIVRTKNDYNKIRYGSRYILDVPSRPRETRTKAPTFTLVYDENRKDERIADFPKGYVKIGKSFGQFRNSLVNKYQGTASQRDLRFPVNFRFKGGPRDGKDFSRTINAFKR